jgi:hypothetical protein
VELQHISVELAEAEDGTSSLSITNLILYVMKFSARKLCALTYCTVRQVLLLCCLVGYYFHCYYVTFLFVLFVTISVYYEMIIV